MDDLEIYLVWAAAIAFVAIAIIAWRHTRKMRRMNRRERYVYDTLELARGHFELFNIKMRQSEIARPGLTVMLRDIDAAGLHMEASDYVTPDWDGQAVEVFFKIRRDEIPVFYVFLSRVKKLKADYESSYLLLETPDHMRVEKKRHFLRVKPASDEILAISLWPLPPGSRLPDSARDLGEPAAMMTAENGKNSTIVLDNISGAGAGLRLCGENAKALDNRFMKGSQIISMIRFTPEKDVDITFWCTGEVMSARTSPGDKACVTLGVEFTNWAAESDGETVLHWSHCSPSRGVKPILKWAEKIDAAQRNTA